MVPYLQPANPIFAKEPKQFHRWGTVKHTERKHNKFSVRPSFSLGLLVFDINPMSLI